ncbi:hypothetical protein FA13DRAFT_1133048 [Coprinellus micaceus]|uniref:Uncharacterized protein n=1 Tax=Coprinellus micaceus TaxID=71717 RepID=A0A4Y7SW65_COPMI|nr:hypothetical protein FA13DRAFT_1133048 [Coprinellus micaceus]
MLRKSRAVLGWGLRCLAFKGFDDGHYGGCTGRDSHHAAMVIGQNPPILKNLSSISPPAVSSELSSWSTSRGNNSKVLMKTYIFSKLRSQDVLDRSTGYGMAGVDKGMGMRYPTMRGLSTSLYSPEFPTRAIPDSPHRRLHSPRWEGDLSGRVLGLGSSGTWDGGLARAVVSGKRRVAVF